MTTISGINITISELIDVKNLLTTHIIHSHKDIRTNYSGDRLSKIKGHGIDFDEVREYQFGDDIRSIDWKTSARMQTTYSKTYKEERDRPILLFIDFSNTMFFGTKVAFKSVIASKLATLIAYIGAHHKDKIGGIIYSQYGHIELKPKSGKIGVQNLIRYIVHMHEQALYAKDNAKQQAAITMANSLLKVKRIIRPGSVLFIISDFANFDENSQNIVQQITKHNDIVINFIYDNLEKTAPKSGKYRINNGKHHKQLNTYSKKNKQLYQQYFIDKNNFLIEFCHSNNLLFMPIKTDDKLAQKILDSNINFHK